MQKLPEHSTSPPQSTPSVCLWTWRRKGWPSVPQKEEEKRTLLKKKGKRTSVKKIKNKAAVKKAIYIINMIVLSVVYWVGCILGSLLLVLNVLRIIIRAKGGWCSSKVTMEGKVVLITGASAGIGKEAARDLARRGARIIMGCRNMQKAKKVADDIRQDTGGLVEVLQLDTSSLASVRAFANEIIKTEKRLDVLILNAGIGGPPSVTHTKEGLELTMATNYFGHFLLANLLLGLLRTTAPSRVVVVSSLLHRTVEKLNLEALNISEEKNYQRKFAYALSKVCNILFAVYLSHLLKDDGVTVNSLCPGFVHTEIMKKMEGIVYKLKEIIFSMMAKNEVQGAQTTIHLAVSEEVAVMSGKFFENCKLSKASDLASDLGLAKKLWEKTEEIVKLEEHEKHF